MKQLRQADSGGLCVPGFSGTSARATTAPERQQSDRSIGPSRDPQSLVVGEPISAGAQFAGVYEELRRIARRRFREQSPRHTLQPTALVHEAFLRMAEHTREAWRDEAHFRAIAETAMRQIGRAHV